MLADNRQRLVTREEILQAIWGNDVFVDADNSINNAVRKVRQALKDDPETPRFVRTVPGKGYRFTAQIIVRATLSPPLASPVPAEPASEPQPVPNGLRKLAFWLAIALVALFAAGLMLRSRMVRSNKLAERKVMLVVLPFVNISRDPGEDYFADGMTEEIITQLGSLDPERLGVIARTSSMQYKGSKKGIAQVARELGVDYVLEGSVRRDDRRVRVTAQLIQASDQTHLWEADFDRDLSDVLKL